MNEIERVLPRTYKALQARLKAASQTSSDGSKPELKINLKLERLVREMVERQGRPLPPGEKPLY